MVKDTYVDEGQNYKSNSSDKLIRRPIHKGAQHLDGKQREHEKLYPELSNEDDLDLGEEQFEESKLYHTEEVRSEDELKKFKRHVSEKPRKTVRDNDKGKRGKLSNLANAASIPFYDFSYLIIFLFSLLLIILVVVLYNPFSSKPVIEPSLKEKLKSMQSLFKDQNYLTFHILEKALDKVINVTQEPNAPAIITVTVNKNARYKSHKFSHYLAKTLAPQNTIYINESVSWENNPDEFKLKIDNEIQSVAKAESLFVVVVDNLQNIPLKSAMIFHNFCDHEAAPFKEAVFVFILPLNEIFDKDTPIKKIDKAASHQLKNIWHKATPDEIDSLITRITVNVINIS